MGPTPKHLKRWTMHIEDMNKGDLVMTHTPGPWRIVKRGNQMGRRVLAVALDKSKGASSWLPGTGLALASLLSSEDEANARLIAAAPDLLAALKWAEDYLGGWPADSQQRNCREAVKAAIRKAEIGEQALTR